LVVGESHYGKPEERNDRDITKRVIRQRIDESCHGQFFGVIERVVGGKAFDDPERFAFWSKTGFLNYAPHLVDEGHACEQRHFGGAAKRLCAHVKEWNPDLVAFFSAAAWSRRPWGEHPFEESFGELPESYEGLDSVTVYRGKGLQRPVIMARFNHPRALGAPIEVWRVWFEWLTKIDLR
jgi:hypothetical protein